MVRHSGDEEALDASPPTMSRSPTCAYITALLASALSVIPDCLGSAPEAAGNSASRPKTFATSGSASHRADAPSLSGQGDIRATEPGAANPAVQAAEPG
jgi:hypothetical protein